ncbi:adenosine deaminase family protein [Verminephrobacter eiseniae]|uniref:adenosine deaminase family protein n=1 Tax=Verminephrobacter eiseniae TaxID=364317 RepID=UPI0022371B80|nr:adenosine deaminase [Verminephrobacter eiseniae]MCW5237399.1 adenosine deaminase [Verminephrobacter eiseniae]
MTPAGPTPAPLTLEAMLRAMPKVELHAHLFGTVRHETFKQLNQRAGAPLAASEIESFYTRSEKPVGVLRVLRALDAQLVRGADDLYQLTLEYLQDAAAHNVHHAEFFWNPTGTVHASCIAYPMAQAAIVRAIRDAQQDFGITGRLIAAIDREASPEAAVEMVEWVNANRCDEVIGIGIDYRENGRPPELFMQAYAEAKRAGLKTTAHAGEFGMPWTYVRSALDMLKVDRIDHGYTVVDRPEFARECAERGVLFTVVPTNSYYLRTLPPERWALDHPIRRMPGLGLRIHPNTDDPRLHKVTPTQAWLMMVRDFGFGLDDLRGFMHNGLDGAWIDDTQRRAWRAQWSDAFDTLRARLPTASIPGTQGETPP